MLDIFFECCPNLSFILSFPTTKLNLSAEVIDFCVVEYI
jgi:hypothetical protein